MVSGPIRVSPASSVAGASDPLSALLAGRVLEARLSLALADGLFRFTSPDGEIDLPLPRALPAGTRVAIAAQPGGGFQVTVLGQETPPVAGARPGTAQPQDVTQPPLDLVVKPANGDAGLPPLGRNVAATVIDNPQPGLVRVQAPGGEVDLPLPRPVPEGTVIRLTAQRGGAAQVHVPAQTVSTSPAATAALRPAASAQPPIHVFTARPVGPAPDIAPGKVVEARVISSTPEGVVGVATRAGNFALPVGRVFPPGTEARIAVQPGGVLVMTVRTEPVAVATAGAGGTASSSQPILIPPGAAVPVLTPGTMLTARIVAAADNGSVRLAGPTGEFQLPLGQPLAPGSVVRITAQADGGLLLVPEPPEETRPRPAALSDAVQQAARSAVARQGGMAVLFADVEELVARPDLPQEVRRAAEAVLDRRLPLELLARPDQLARAIAVSGLFAERNLSALAGQAPADLKLALFVLRAVLGSGSHIRTDESAKPDIRLLPPQPGTPPAAQAPASRAGGQGASLPVEQLLPRIASESDAALARINLHQIASLPENGPASARADAPDMRFSCEIPVNVDGRTAVFGFVIERDGHRAQAKTEKRRWRVRAALDLAETGAVEADVRLHGETVTAGLLAERPQTAALLEAALPMLRDGLIAAGFEVDGLSVRLGKAAPDAATPGHFMDLRS